MNCGDCDGVSSSSEVTTLRRYTNLFIIIIIIIFWPRYSIPEERKNYAMQYNNIIIIILAHQHKACRQLKIKQEMTAVGD